MIIISNLSNIYFHTIYALNIMVFYSSYLITIHSNLSSLFIVNGSMPLYGSVASMLSDVTHNLIKTIVLE